MRKVGLPLFLLFLSVALLPLPGYPAGPTYPIIADVQTTRQRTVNPATITDDPTPHLTVKQVSLYEPRGYSSWQWGDPGLVDYGPLLLIVNGSETTAAPTPVDGPPLLSFFTMSDIHIVDKESPAQAIYSGIDPLNTGFGEVNTSAYSPIMLSTTHVLDAAVQTINALHRNPGPNQAPFDFGMSLGDDANNNQYNELRWFIDVLDGKWITPSTGAHLGANYIDYQKVFKSAGLDRSIPWYQTIGNHDQFWCGSLLYTDYVRRILLGNTVLDMGTDDTGFPTFDVRQNYMGVIDGRTPYGDIIKSGPVEDMAAPYIVPDPKRRALSTNASPSLNWMKEFFTTTSLPKGHGFTQSNIDNDFASYTFEPKASVPLKVIVLDNTCKENPYASQYSSYARACLDQERYDWLVEELDKGQAEGKLMIITAHIPVGPQANVPDNPVSSIPNDTLYPLFLSKGTSGPTCMPNNLENCEPLTPYNVVTDYMLLTKLHTYSNLLLWLAGHRHLNVVTPQPSTVDGHPEFGFWEVETSSLRDFPQQFRTFNIVRNTNNTVSIFVTDVDPAVQEDPSAPHATLSPAAKSRGYAIGANKISVGGTFAFTDTTPHVYNAELIKPLATPYTMTVNVAGNGSGTVISSPYSGITCPTASSPCTAEYLPGTEVTLVATPATNSAFAGWSTCTGKSTCTITMDSNVDVTATFTQDPTATVTPAQKDFGGKWVRTRTTATFTIKNTRTKGTADLIIGSISLTQSEAGQFTLTAGKDYCSGRTIRPTKTCTFQVSFRPTTKNTKTATVSIPSNDPNVPPNLGQPVTVLITGVGK